MILPSAGVIEGYYPQECPENYTSNLEFLDTKLFPMDTPHALPDFLFYDRACFLAACFGKSLQKFSHRWSGLQWRVDRFHFLGHSASDRHCRFVPAPCILHMLALNVYNGWVHRAGKIAMLLNQGETTGLCTYLTAMT